MDESTTSKHRFISEVHDIKETSKRATQFCLVGIIVTLIKVITNIIHGNMISAILDTGLIAGLAILVWIIIKGDIRIANYGLIITLNTSFVLISFAEGLKTASTLYFLPLLFAIPFFIENHKSYKLQVAIFFSFTLACFSVCIFSGLTLSPWQNISDKVVRQIFITNCFCSFVVCAVFSYLSIYLERKYANALLTQFKKTQSAMEARTKFLSTMGHELRTPLNGIIGATNLLRSTESLPEQKDYLGILKYCSDHMMGLVNDILDFNKIEAGQFDLHPVQCNIKKLLKQSTAPFYHSFGEKKIELKVSIDDLLDEVVLVDDLRLVQVMNNLISNALKFTETGYVKLEVYQKERKNNFSTILFSVQDTGIGIDEIDQEKIFGSFWQVNNETTRKYGGTGLGLTITERLLKMMDSHLFVESEAGKGSRFYFSITVPVVDRLKEKKLIPVESSSDLQGIRILLAEDNMINMMIAKKFLEDKNAILTTVENGQLALDCLQRNNLYDIILLDLEMPVMDGYTAITELRKKCPNIPVLAFTAALMDQDMLQKLLQLGFLDYISKPFQPLDLYAKVRKYATPVIAAKSLHA